MWPKGDDEIRDLIITLLRKRSEYSAAVKLMQLQMKELQIKACEPQAGSMTPRAIEDDDFPFEGLSRIAERESWRKEIYRPIYHVHKWWAQRLGSVFRGILLGALTPQGTDILDLFYSTVRFEGSVVFDPFMGSGTTLGETLKLGGRAIGRDINPVSYQQVRTALTLRDSTELEKTYQEIEADVADTISGYYTACLPNGKMSRVLYYFWVMQAPCPVCHYLVDLFSTFIFARHAYTRRNPKVRVLCPKCGAISSEDYKVRRIKCSECGHGFDPTIGPAKGKAAKCPQCLCEFVIARAIRETGSPPIYRMYAKLVLTHDEKKEYHSTNAYDETLYQAAATELETTLFSFPMENIEPGHNTNQVLNYGFRNWNQMFNSRQLFCISLLANRIKEVHDVSLRDAFACLFSGVLEFNNMFASYKGEGTGAVRHMFYHHILKPERTPLEANIWGTPKSSGAFSTLFRSRLLRAAQYARQPFELALSPNETGKQSLKAYGINEPLTGIANSASHDQFRCNSKLYVSCGDSAVTDLSDESVDLVVTDPPFFDNVHYSQLADFFYVWQRVIFEDSPSHRPNTTRSMSEVQNSDPIDFTERLAGVFRECRRVLKDEGLLVFTYHHSRWEGWQCVFNAVIEASFQIVACHPVKAEMSVATPKQQAKSPINFDVIIVCRKRHTDTAETKGTEEVSLSQAFARAEVQIARLRTSGWNLSRNDIGVVVMAQVVCEISRRAGNQPTDQALASLQSPIVQAIDRLESLGQIEAERQA